jgi:hypothetical protein
MQFSHIHENPSINPICILLMIGDPNRPLPKLEPHDSPPLILFQTLFQLYPLASSDYYNSITSEEYKTAYEYFFGITNVVPVHGSNPTRNEGHRGKEELTEVNAEEEERPEECEGVFAKGCEAVDGMYQLFGEVLGL